MACAQNYLFVHGHIDTNRAIATTSSSKNTNQASPSRADPTIHHKYITWFNVPEQVSWLGFIFFAVTEDYRHMAPPSSFKPFPSPRNGGWFQLP